MAIMDYKLILSSAQAVTVDADSDNILDLAAAGNAIDNDLYLVVRTNAAATADGNATVTFALVTDSASAFNVAPVTLYSTAAIGKASLPIKSEPVKVKLPLGLKRYVKLTYTIGTGPLTAGSFDAYIAPSVEAVSTVLR